MPLIEETTQGSDKRDAVTESLCKDQCLINRLELRMKPVALTDCSRNGSADGPVKGKSFLRASLILVAGCIAAIFAVLCSVVFKQEVGPVFLVTFSTMLLILGSTRSTLRHIERANTKQERNAFADGNNNALFHDASGKLVMFFGIFLPAFISACSCCFALFPPSLASVQALASAIVPIGILLAWQEVRGRATSFPVLRRVSLGCAAIYLGLLSFSVWSTTPALTDAMWSLVPAVGIFCLIAFLGKRLLSTPCKLGIGSIIALVAYTLLACLLPSSEEIIRGLKVLAINSDLPVVRRIGQSLTSEKQLAQSIEISSAPSQFSRELRFPVNPAACQEAYYRMTGRTYRPEANLSSFERDPFYAAPTVGSVIVDNVRVSNSELKAEIDSKRLCASFDWSFDFVNTKGAPGQEARLQLALPKHSAVTAVQLYSKECVVDSKAEFSTTVPLFKKYSEDAIRMRDPVIATMIGSDKVLLQCAPILSPVPVRVRLKIVSPLNPDSNCKSARVQVPYISASNVGGFSANHLCLSADGKVLNEKGNILKTGDSYDLDIKKECNLSVAMRGPVATTFQAADMDGGVRRIERSMTAAIAGSEKFVLAVDGSRGNEVIKTSIAEFLKQVPQDRICKIFFADPLQGTREISLASASQQLRSSAFDGGDHNRELLMYAIKAARESHAQVLWIHPAKPWTVHKSWVNEIGYGYGSPENFSALCGNSIKVYDYQTSLGENELIERIHASGGDLAAFVTLPCHGSLTRDLMSFLSNRSEVAFKFASKDNRQQTRLAAGENLVALADARVVADLINSGKRKEAEEYARNHHQVSIYTAALCQPGQLATLAAPLQWNQNSVNGTIGPQGADATVIQGVSTAGIVRVNNLARLEALLNIVANGIEVLGLCWGLPMMIVGVLNLSSKAGPGRAVLGGGLTLVGLATPGCINWLVASGRDINVFS
ncbi:MAG: hypothetical protein K2W95_29590 [Candidatus Obscuribacterales bacterium]|nr:hypothetical protein [Candidatus Obscuribacterales bacterium]